MESLNPGNYAQVVLDYLDNPQKYKETRQYNIQYAKDNFMASIVANRLEMRFENWMDNN